MPELSEGQTGIFCSYSHRDAELLSEFNSHIAILRRTEDVVVWTDREIPAGGRWQPEIDSHLESASVIVLLVSADFINSDFCYTKEMTRAMERHAAREALVIPVIVRPCLWQKAPFGQLQALPTGGKPVTEWANRDSAWTDVAIGLEKVVALVVEESHRKVQALAAQLSADTQRQAMERWKILRDTQEMILALQSDVSAKTVLAGNEAFRKWDRYIRGDVLA